MSVAQSAQVTGPLLNYRNLSLLAAGVVVKALPGTVFEFYISNNNAAPLYVKLYDKATAPTTADTPIRTIYINTKSVATIYTDHGINFANGISLRACTGVADSDNTAPAANDVVVNLTYL